MSATCPGYGRAVFPAHTRVAPVVSRRGGRRRSGREAGRYRVEVLVPGAGAGRGGAASTGPAPGAHPVGSSIWSMMMIAPLRSGSR